MKFKGNNFDWNHAKSFLVAVESGSFSAGAEELGVTQPTISRQICSLEEELGVLLLERSSKGISLTESGEELLHYFKEMSRISNTLSLLASGRSEVIEGTVTISASDLIAMHVLPKIVKGLKEVAPDIDIKITSTDDQSDLQQREADIAIRAKRPQQPELIARKLKKVHGRLYASTEYIDKIGRPLTREKLNEVNYVGLNQGGILKEILAMHASISPIKSSVVVDNTLVQWEFIRNHLGAVFFLEDIADNDPLVERLVPEIPPLTYDLWLVVHRELRTSRRLQIVFNYLAEQLC